MQIVGIKTESCEPLVEGLPSTGSINGSYALMIPFSVFPSLLLASKWDGERFLSSLSYFFNRPRIYLLSVETFRF